MSINDKREEATGTYHLLLCSNFGFARRTGALQVRNNATGSEYNEFAPPGKPGCGLDRSVGVAVSVPVTGDEVHVRAKYYAAIVYLNGTARDVQLLLHVDVAWVRRRLIVRDERVQANNLLAMEQRFEVIALNSTPSLVFVNDKTAVNYLEITYCASGRPFTNKRHGKGSRGGKVYR